MDAIHHETHHAYAADVINKKLINKTHKQSSEKEIEYWTANQLNYLKPDDNYAGIDFNTNNTNPLYKLQPLEKSANNYAEKQTRKAIKFLEEQIGTHEFFNEYIKNIEDNSFNRTSKKAEKIFKTNNILDIFHNDINKKYEKAKAENSVKTNIFQTIDYTSRFNLSEIDKFQQTKSTNNQNENDFEFN
jgi:hypothetical protein